MFKLNYGGITNPNNGEHREVEVSMLKPNTIKDGVIGCGIIAVGVAYLMMTAFRHGADKYDEANTKALVDCGLIKETEI